MYDCWYKNVCKIVEYIDAKNCSCEKIITDKSALTCEDEILNATEISFDNKIAICENNCLIHTVLLVNICTFLLVLVSTGCYYYYTKYRKKQKHYVIEKYS